MAKMQLALVIGGAVASSVGAAFKNVEGRITKLEQKGNKAKVLKSTIGETIKLQAEWKRAHDTGSAGADKLLRKLNGNLDSLRKQGVEVGRLSREYQRLSREARAADLQVKGHQQISAGKEGFKSSVGTAAVGMGLAAIPTKVSADYQAIIRDIAIKADAVNKPEEVQLNRTVIQTAKDSGMARNDVADLINQLVGAGMELDKAMAYAPTAAKFAIGQGASGVDTASMVMALQQNAKITDPKVMQQALEAIAFQGQAGSFEANDMAKWFPQLLAGMEKNGITGMDSVASLGAMLQVQMKTAGSSDEAANNFKNWMEKIGAGDVVKAYKDAGIDYQASLNTGLQKGMNVIESSMALAMKYVEATDPAKAEKMKKAQAKIDKEVDPEKAKAALEALEKTLRTGDLFADMQVKAALTAYAQNRGLYTQLKADSQNATGILDKNLAERRETSSQRWAELGQAWNDSLRSIGDAIRPATDAVAQGLTAVLQGMGTLSDKFPGVVMGLAGLAAAVSALLTARSVGKVARGAFNVARGRSWGGRRFNEPLAGAEALPKTGNRVIDAGMGALGRVLGRAPSNDPVAGLGNEPMRVFVVNAEALGRMGGGPLGGGPAEPGSRRARRRRKAAALATDRPATKAATVPAVKAAAAGVEATKDAKYLGQMVRGVRAVTKSAGNLPGGKVLDAIPGVIDTALNAETKDEKAEGYGGVAGSMAGAWAGAAAGAAIGSVVPLVGTAIGGAIGMALGGLAGESAGGWLGKALFGEDKTEAGQVAKAESAPTKKAGQVEPFAASMPAPVVKDLDAGRPTKPVDQMSDKEVEQAYAKLPKFAQHDLFEGGFPYDVSLDAPPPKPRPEPPKVDQAQAIGLAMRELGKVQALSPAVTPLVTQAISGGVEPGAMGGVVRALVASAQPAAAATAAATKAPPPVKPEAPKVEQAYSLNLSMPITVQGDMKDPYQLVRDMEQPLRDLFGTLQRDLASRQASIRLFDAADVA